MESPSYVVRLAAQVVQRRSALLTSETPHSTLDGCVRIPPPKYFGRTTRDAASWVAGILQERTSHLAQEAPSYRSLPIAGIFRSYLEYAPRRGDLLVRNLGVA